MIFTGRTLADGEPITDAHRTVNQVCLEQSMERIKLIEWARVF